MPFIDTAEYVNRRHLLCQQLPENAMAIIPAAPQSIRNGDTHYPYRQHSDFYYLTGFNEPDAVLILLKKGTMRTLIFNLPPDPIKEAWEGKRLAQQGAITELKVDAAFPIQDLEKQLLDLCNAHPIIYYAPGNNTNIDSLLPKHHASSTAESNVISAWCDIRPMIHEMRLVKSDAEIALMRRAADISAVAHLQAMQACKPGIYEYQLEAEIVYTLLKNNCRQMAYPAIIGGGANACILHYQTNKDLLKNNDLVLIDAAGEYHGYAADITRTFPINGKFSAQQRALYEIVLNAQLAGIAEVKPGNAWPQIQQTIIKIITQGLVELKILKGNVDDLIAAKAYQAFYMHNSGHWLGLDVHDVGNYQSNGQPRTLRPGMVLTVEPGIYIAEHPSVDRQWWNIGIRIEDDILVTNDSCEILSHRAPKTIAEIEAVMAK